MDAELSVVVEDLAPDSDLVLLEDDEPLELLLESLELLLDELELP